MLLIQAPQSLPWKNNLIVELVCCVENNNGCNNAEDLQKLLGNFLLRGGKQFTSKCDKRWESLNRFAGNVIVAKSQGMAWHGKVEGQPPG